MRSRTIRAEVSLLIRPTVGDIGGGVGADGVKAPLAQRELAIEAIDQVQTERDDGQDRAQVEDCARKLVMIPSHPEDLDEQEEADQPAEEDEFVAVDFLEHPGLCFLAADFTEYAGGADEQHDDQNA